MTDKDRLLAIANDALNRVCDHDLMGNPITDYSVLMMGAYASAVHRIVDAVAAELTARDAEIARLREALEAIRTYDLERKDPLADCALRQRARDALSQPASAQGKCAAWSNVGANDPQDCDWPLCGCDEHANNVIAVLEECGYLVERPASAPAAQGEQDSKAPYAEIPPGVFFWNTAAPKEPK